MKHFKVNYERFESSVAPTGSRLKRVALANRKKFWKYYLRNSKFERYMETGLYPRKFLSSVYNRHGDPEILRAELFDWIQE